MLTASSQLRSAGREGSVNADALIAFGKEESWQEKIMGYAWHYAEQVKKDHMEFVSERMVEHS